MECKCETCARKECQERTKQDDLRIVISCLDYLKYKMTNADRIRAMTDEELAEYLGHSNLCVRIQHSSTWCEEHGSCDGCLEEWMKQPAEVDNG